MAEPVEEKQLSIFITGAGQGVGLAATKLAARAGHKVVGTTNLGSKGAYRIRRAGGLPIFPDLTRESAVYSALQMAHADVIINAAPQAVNGIPQHILDYDESLPWLISSTEAIMAAAGRADITRIIHLSAASIYGDTHHETVTEDAHLDLSNDLAKALHEAENIVLDGGVPAYILRTGYIMGTHQASAEVAQALIAGKGMPHGKQATSWAHEEDVASAAISIAEKTEDAQIENIYNIASSETISPNEFINKFGTAVGVGEPGPMAGFLLQFRTSEMQRSLMGMSTLMDTSKAREALDWSPNGTIETALDNMLLLWRAEESEVTVYHQAEDSEATGIVKA